MDRDKIERRDFPTGRKGYDPAAVDEHLRRVADEFEAQVQHIPVPSLSAGTSEQVRLILEAAERSAAELQTRAGDEASAHVSRVQQSAAGLMTRLDELESELSRLLAALRRSGERLTQGLEALQEDVSKGGPSPLDTVPAEPVAPKPRPRRTPRHRKVAEPVAPPVDEEGARLTALNMALGGSTREETGRYLTEHFGIEDPSPLLDDVFARAGR